MIKKAPIYYLKFDKGGVVALMSTFKISESQANISIANEIEAKK